MLVLSKQVQKYLEGRMAITGFAWTAGTFHWIPLDPQVYAVSYVPFHPNVLDGLWIALVAMAISIAATLVPARAASRLLPVEILRFE